MALTRNPTFLTGAGGGSARIGERPRGGPTRAIRDAAGARLRDARREATRDFRALAAALHLPADPVCAALARAGVARAK